MAHHPQYVGYRSPPRRPDLDYQLYRSAIGTKWNIGVCGCVSEYHLLCGHAQLCPPLYVSCLPHHSPLDVALWTFVPAFAILMFLSGWRWITNLRNDETYFKPVKLTTHSFAIIMSAMRIVQCVLVNILKLQKQYPEDLYIWNIFDWPCWFMFIIVQVMYVRAMGMPTPKNIL